MNKKVIALVVVALMSLSLIGVSLADSSQSSWSEGESLLSVDKSHVISTQELNEILKEIEKFENNKGTFSERDMDEILKKLDRVDVEILSKAEINEKFGIETSMNSAETLSASYSVARIDTSKLKQSILILSDTQYDFTAELSLYNATGESLDQVSGHTYGYVEIYPGKYVQRLDEYTSIIDMKSGATKKLDEMTMKTYGYGAYYINEFVITDNGQTITVPPVTFHNNYINY